MELINQRKTGSQPQEKEKYEKQTEPILRLGPRPLRPGPSNKEPSRAAKARLECRLWWPGGLLECQYFHE